ncbi:uncharacterized protein BDZ83DRAFT_15508 [Colletotrichum acutatum]|uniref:Uncharacterized protein n=1 Tax=Glomerella acutata TaxID=27357 RepID=A0AAD9D1E4_GLOAC|nr:uncharacterized protein BDZ83DRAFT_15508 [Colletotrichum acutatum]KAK1729716.1 hypothetical protein BDZ83DRAFT_15508 [Colletotrichum acutatum]
MHWLPTYLEVEVAFAVNLLFWSVCNQLPLAAFLPSNSKKGRKSESAPHLQSCSPRACSTAAAPHSFYIPEIGSCLSAKIFKHLTLISPSPTSQILSSPFCASSAFAYFRAGFRPSTACLGFLFACRCHCLTYTIWHPPRVLSSLPTDTGYRLPCG